MAVLAAESGVTFRRQVFYAVALQHFGMFTCRQEHETYLSEPEPVVQELLGEMTTWVRCVRLSLKAEFPDYELLQAYSVFNVQPSGHSHRHCSY
jgi:hypothetical protein